MYLTIHQGSNRGCPSRHRRDAAVFPSISTTKSLTLPRSRAGGSIRPAGSSPGDDGPILAPSAAALSGPTLRRRPHFGWFGIARFGVRESHDLGFGIARFGVSGPYVWGPGPGSLGSGAGSLGSGPGQFGVRHRAVWGPALGSLGSGTGQFGVRIWYRFFFQLSGTKPFMQPVPSARLFDFADKEQHQQGGWWCFFESILMKLNDPDQTPSFHRPTPSGWKPPSPAIRFTGWRSMAISPSTSGRRTRPARFPSSGRWITARNIGQPGPLAYKLDTLIINRRIEEARRPIPKIIRLGSLKDICRELGLAEKGGNTNQIKNALHQNAFAGITAKIRYRQNDGTRADAGSRFHPLQRRPHRRGAARRPEGRCRLHHAQ